MDIAAQTLIEEHSIPEPNMGCWLWMWRVQQNGYGRVSHDGRSWLTHRLSFTAFVGAIPPGLFVCHKCDVKCCANPRHLFVGTPQDNVDDYRRKKYGACVNEEVVIMPRRQHVGEHHWRTRLTVQDIRDIRARVAGGELMRIVAEKYSITRVNVVHIVNRTTWKHVDP